MPCSFPGASSHLWVTSQARVQVQHDAQHSVQRQMCTQATIDARILSDPADHSQCRQELRQGLPEDQVLAPGKSHQAGLHERARTRRHVVQGDPVVPLPSILSLHKNHSQIKVSLAIVSRSEVCEFTPSIVMPVQHL